MNKSNTKLNGSNIEPLERKETITDMSYMRLIEKKRNSSKDGKRPLTTLPTLLMLQPRQLRYNNNNTVNGLPLESPLELSLLPLLEELTLLSESQILSMMINLFPLFKKNE